MSDEAPETPKSEPPLSWTWPGKINIANERGYFTGCRAVHFKNVDEMNAYFESVQKVLVVEVLNDNYGSITAFYTKQLDKDEEIEFEHFQREMGWHMAEWRRKVTADKKRDADLAAAGEKEKERLAAVGKHCEADHGRLIKELRERAAKKAIKDVK